MLRRILFLDIDGVCNSAKDRNPDYMNPNNLDILNELQDELGFEIVLSSTWRMIFDFETFNVKFLRFGAKSPVIDYTPHQFQLPDEDMGDGYYGYGGWSLRGDEIQAWLTKHGLVPGENCSICILDDLGGEHFKHLMKYHIKTSMKDGLHKGHKTYVHLMFKKQEKTEAL